MGVWCTVVWKSLLGDTYCQWHLVMSHSWVIWHIPAMVAQYTVRRSLSKECLRTLVHALVTSHVDHCNGLLYSSYSYLLDRLQSMRNSAARLVLNIAKFSGISAAIRDELHWLPIRKRMKFKIVLLVRHCLVGVLDGTVLSCQFSRWSTKPPVCFQRRPYHSSFPTPNIWFPSFCDLGPSDLELTPIGR